MSSTELAWVVGVAAASTYIIGGYVSIYLVARWFPNEKYHNTGWPPPPLIFAVWPAFLTAIFGIRVWRKGIAVGKAKQVEP